MMLSHLKDAKLKVFTEKIRGEEGFLCILDTVLSTMLSLNIL